MMNIIFKKMEKYNFDDLMCWDKDKIVQFLIRDFVENMDKINKGGTYSFLIDSFCNSAKKYKKYRFFIDSTDVISNFLFSFKFFKNNNHKSKKILFNEGGRFPEIILGVKKNNDIYMVSKAKKDRLFAIKNRIKYVSYSGFNQCVCSYLKSKNPHYLYKLINKVENSIKKIYPDCIVLSNDCFPFERAMVFVGKKLKIPTIVIQHGCVSPQSVIIDGRVADFIFAWGKYFKNLYVKKNNRKEKDIYILGYPYNIKNDYEFRKEKKKQIVYFLGQNIEKYAKTTLNYKLFDIIKVARIVKKLGMKFIYRPHPGDELILLKENLKSINFSSKKEKLQKVFKKGDMFLGYTSTALAESAIYLKIAIQLFYHPFNTVNFEKLGVCNKSVSSFEELENYLLKIKEAKNLDNFKLKFNNNYIKLSSDSASNRFIELLNKVGKNGKN